MALRLRALRQQSHERVLSGLMEETANKVPESVADFALAVNIADCDSIESASMCISLTYHASCVALNRHEANNGTQGRHGRRQSITR